MEQKFSVEAFWKKVKHVAKQAGQSVIYASLLLFYVLELPVPDEFIIGNS
ncbi:hypothetical protein [Acinetobacter nosocomialis]